MLRVAACVGWTAALTLASPGASGATGANSEAQETWVLPAGQERAVQAALAAPLRAPDGRTLPFAGASIERSRIDAHWKASQGPEIAIHLVHVSTAPPGSPAAGDTAVVADATTPSWAVEQVAARLRSAPARLQWAKAQPKPPPGAGGELDEATRRALQERIGAIAHHLKLGDRDEALKEAHELAARGDALPSWARVSVAALLVALGERTKGEELARTALGTDVDMRARAILGTLPKPAEVIAALRKPCEAQYVADVLDTIGRQAEAVALRRAVLDRDPGCHEVTATLVRSLISQGHAAEARAVLDGPAGHSLDDVARNLLRIEVLRAGGEIGKAARLLERVVRAHPELIPEWAGHLVALFSWAGITAEDEARWRSHLGDPNDHGISTFMLGVREHYQGHYEASLRHLDPLAKDPRWRQAPRLYVYRAMDLFNLGDDDGALELLNEAFALKRIDPDVYYCRAEVLRFRDPRQAVEDFRHYLALSDRPDETRMTVQRRKVARVSAAMRWLERRVQQGRIVGNGGPFEHPRNRKRPERRRKLALALFAGLVLGGVAIAAGRLRGR